MAIDASTTHEIESRTDLIAYFHSGAKPRADWRVGAEYEKLLVSTTDGRALPFSGETGVEVVLRKLADRFGWEPVEENGRVIALKGANNAITLEPGGQLELSGRQCDSIHCVYREIREHIIQLLEVTRELGAAVIALGMQPVSTLEQIELTPKRRYHIMFPYMGRKGALGQRMMKQTAGIQANLDFSDERDAMRKLRLAFGLAPLIYAAFANSPLCDGDLNGYQSFRGHIWNHTDPDRCGVPRFVFNEGVGFEEYVEYALDVPMYFIYRDEGLIDLTQPPGLTFRRFLEEGYNGTRASLGDWAVHLTTIFTEVRLKRYIEIRSADSQAPALVMALPALLKGVLYDDDCLGGAWDLVKKWSYEEHTEITNRAHRAGLETRVGRFKMRDLVLELLEIALTGLARISDRNEAGDDESIYLYPLLEMVRSGHNPATRVIEHWKGRWNYDIARLVDALSYKEEDLIFG